MPFEAVQAGEELPAAVGQLAGHAADHRPAGAGQADKGVAEELFPGLGQIGVD